MKMALSGGPCQCWDKHKWNGIDSVPSLRKSGISASHVCLISSIGPLWLNNASMKSARTSASASELHYRQFALTKPSFAPLDAEDSRILQSLHNPCLKIRRFFRCKQHLDRCVYANVGGWLVKVGEAARNNCEAPKPRRHVDSGRLTATATSDRTPQMSQQWT